jgi:guanylate kinase
MEYFFSFKRKLSHFVFLLSLSAFVVFVVVEEVATTTTTAFVVPTIIARHRQKCCHRRHPIININKKKANQHGSADNEYVRRGKARNSKTNDNDDDAHDDDTTNFFMQRATGGEVYQDQYGRTIQKPTQQINEGNSSNNNNELTNQIEAETTIVKPNLEPLVVCGPSGVGKGTVIDCLRKRYPSEVFGFSVSHTTRQPRLGEIHGQHYYFTTIEDIQPDIDQGMFVEHALVHGNYYGTSKEAIKVLQDENKITILDIDMQGVISVKESNVPAKYIFIAPPSMVELENRLRGRGTETEDAIQKRLGNAAKEIEYGQQQDDEFDNRIFVNNDVENTVNEIIEVLNEWYPQLKEGSVVSIKQQQQNQQQQVTDEEQSTTVEAATKETNRAFDIMSESDTMLDLSSVRMHNRLEPVDRAIHEEEETTTTTTTTSDEKGEISDEEEDILRFSASSPFRYLGNTDPNIQK